MSTKHVRTTGDLVRFRCAARIECTMCHAARTITGAELAMAVGSVPLGRAEARLKCRRCGTKGARVIVLPPV